MRINSSAGGALPVAAAMATCALFIPAFAATPNHWENQRVLALNQETSHAPLVPRRNEHAALAASPARSPYFLSLNGPWKFHWVPHPGEAPKGFYRERFDAKDWDEIPVPSNWQMHGYGTLKYVGGGNPFHSDPPNVPDDDNPIGSYRRAFHLPEHWSGRRVYLHFESVKSAFYVWVNGVKIGYNQGSMTPAEFDVTPAVRPGRNTIAVRVYRYSDGTYLEDQDMLRLSGIHRDVYLLSTPPIHIRDLYVTTDLDAQYRDAILSVRAEVKNCLTSSIRGYSLQAQLYDPEREPILDQPMDFTDLRLDPRSVAPAELSTAIEAPDKWSAEHPNLYTLVIQLLSPQGEVTETVAETVGFREIEIDDGALLINGVPVKLNGVNRHDWDPDLGRAVTGHVMEREIRLMKQFNINAVRTSHYPPDPEFLDLADRYGLYIVDEANQEASPNSLSDDPAWREAFVERARSMVMRDRNHPSIVIWSAGNEGGSGKNVAAMVDIGKQLDPSRPAWMYGGNEGPMPFEDIIGPRYPTPSRLRKIGEERGDVRPSFMDEYAHAMGNALSNIGGFWQVIYDHRRCIGGAVWDWRDQGVRGMTDDGEEYFDHLGHPKGCMDGLTSSDLAVQPELWELKKAAQPVNIEPVISALARGRIRVTNRYNFTNLAELDGSWALHEDDELLQQGDLQLNIAPRVVCDVVVPFSLPEVKPGREYWLTVSFRLPRATSWAPAGHEVAWEQFKIPLDVPDAPAVEAAQLPQVTLAETERFIRISGDGFAYTFDRDAGTLSSMIRDGTEIIKRGPILDIWLTLRHKWSRWPGRWRKAGLHDLQRTVTSVAVDTPRAGEAVVQIETTCATPRGGTFHSTYTYRILGTGDIILQVDVSPHGDLPSVLPKIGLELTLPEEFSNFSWYGRGPHGTYPKRESGARIGVYSSTADEQYVPFIWPQEHGNKSDVRWATITNDEGIGLFVMGLPTTNVSVSRFADEDIREALYTHQLKPQNAIILDIDHRLSDIMARYSPLKTERYTYAVGWRAFSARHESAMDLSRRAFPDFDPAR